MKGLLHSKLFRKNLFTWLFMYITVIGLFTSVVTYSKYISSMQNIDGARVAKFDAAITYDGVCAGINENEICDIGAYRPTSEMTYYFTVNNKELEVSTIFVTRISVLEYFKDIKIYDITNTEREATEFIKNGNTFTLTEDLPVSETYIRKYKVTMKFDYEKYDSDHSESKSYNSALAVGYSATQKK